MEVLDAGPEMIPEWDDFVRTHPLASYGHLSAQFALADASGVRNASLVVRDGGRIAGLLPLFAAEQRSLRLVPVRELTSGASSVGSRRSPASATLPSCTTVTSRVTESGCCWI